MMNGGSNPGKTMKDGVHAGAAQPSGKAIYEQRKQYGKASANVGEISQYNVEHLVTFTLDRKEGLTTVADGIRKLKLLDARGKVWTQEALMQVDEKAVKLFDQTTQEELENFPLSIIQYVETVSNADPYSIVALIMKDSDQKTPDMHLFHSPLVPADAIGADIESALTDCKDKKGKKTRPETLRRTRERVQASVIPPPPLNPPPAPPMKDEKIIEDWDSLAQSNDFLTSGKDYGETSPEILSLKVGRDVQILNHALDDVEFFVSRLQKSAQAIQDLEQRKGKKSKAKKKGGEGMLTLRSKLPPQEGFIETFRKFKFCFNLLAKLKSHIQNPNAVEIVHFLFTPLSMIIKSCGGYEIPRSIESPLLTRDAIDLLLNCLTTKESEIWRNLGDLWNKSRAEFPEEHFFPPYVPKFRNGWQPPPISGSEAEESRTPRGEPRRTSDPGDAFRQHVEQHVQRNQQFNTLMAASSAKTKMCRSLYDIAGRNKNELSVRRDELLEVLDDNKAWWRVQNKQGQVGFVPGNHMIVISHNRSPSSNGSESALSSPIAPVPPPPSPAVPPPPPVPKIPPAPKLAPVPVQPMRRESKPVNVNGNNNNPNNQPIYAQSRKSSQGNVKMDRLAEELKGRVITQSGQQRNFSIPKKKASSKSLKVTKESSSGDVKRWLESLGFTQLTVNSLGVLNGAQLFTLTKEELKMVCEEDGARVFSQIQVQKSYLAEGQKGEDELSQILNRQKVKVEGSDEPAND